MSPRHPAPPAFSTSSPWCDPTYNNTFESRSPVPKPAGMIFLKTPPDETQPRGKRERGGTRAALFLLGTTPGPGIANLGIWGHRFRFRYLKRDGFGKYWFQILRILSNDSLSIRKLFETRFQHQGDYLKP